MKFQPSAPQTLGVELELMLLDRRSGQLSPCATQLLHAMHGRRHAGQVKAEITQTMIEINSAVHVDCDELESDLRSLCATVAAAARPLGTRLCGGGAHPFRDWPRQEIFPTPRFKSLHRTYGYLARQFTVFGQHIHIGVANADDAIRLTHWFARFTPHFIALAASSPFQRGVDTAFQSSRVNVTSLFPLSGIMPACRTWKDFTQYFDRMRRTGLVESMKDLYWDIRPKPEFGTVELRICDTPLTLRHAADLAALARALADIGLREQHVRPNSRLFEVYAANRFRAARYGLEGEIFDAISGRATELRADLIRWLDRCRRSCAAKDRPRLTRLLDRVRRENSDAQWIKLARARDGLSWGALMRTQAALLAGPGAPQT